MQRLLRGARKAARSARERGVPQSLAERIGRCYDLLARKALAYHEALPTGSAPSPGAGREGSSGAWLPTSKDLRRRKLRRQISGGFRSAPGARAGAPLRSLLATARQQGLHRLETLRRGPDALVARLPA